MNPSPSMLDHWLTSSWAISSSCFEFMSTAVLPTPEDAALLGPSPTSSSCSLSAPSWVVPEPQEEGQVTSDTHVPSVVEHSPDVLSTLVSFNFLLCTLF